MGTMCATCSKTGSVKAASPKLTGRPLSTMSVTNPKVAFKKFYEQLKGFLDAGDYCHLTIKK